MHPPLPVIEAGPLADGKHRLVPDARVDVQAGNEPPLAQMATLPARSLR
jgi:hypothetical protein